MTDRAAFAPLEAVVEERVTRIVQIMDEAGGSPYPVAYVYLESFVQQLLDGKLTSLELATEVHLIRTAMNLYRVKQRDLAAKESRRGVQRYRGSLTGDRT